MFEGLEVYTKNGLVRVHFKIEESDFFLHVFNNRLD